MILNVHIHYHTKDDKTNAHIKKTTHTVTVTLPNYYKIG